MFAFLSAFGLARSYQKSETVWEKESFWEKSGAATIRRCINLLSGFWAVYLVAFAASFFLHGSSPWELYGGSENGLLVFLGYAFLDMMGIAELVGTPSLVHTWWYMGFALVLILVFPLVYKLYQKFGALIIPAYFCMFCVLGLPVVEYTRWTIWIPVGVWFAEENILEKIRNWRILKTPAANTILKFLLLTGILVVSVLDSSPNASDLSYQTFIRDLFLVLSVIVWVYLFLSGIPVISEILAFLGKYSMNIYLIHTFIRGRWFAAHIYSFHHFLLILLVLLVDSTLFSVVLEAVKKYSGYNRIIQKLCP
jgi:hypothetical protein